MTKTFNVRARTKAGAVVAVALAVASSLWLVGPAAAVDTEQAPARVINGDATDLVNPTNMAVAPDGTIWVANDDAGYDAGSLLAYAPGANGNVAPEYTISGADTGLLSPYGVATDSAGNVWVADLSASAVSEFAVGANGNVAPTNAITGPDTGIFHPTGVAIGSDGTIFVANNGDSILVFAPGATGDVAPERTIEGSNTGFDASGNWGIGLTPTGDILVTVGASTVETFAGSASGNVAPVSILTGSVTGLDTTYQSVRSDADGNVYVASAATSSFSKFAPGAAGNTGPSFRVHGPGSQLADIVALATDASGDVFVAQHDPSATHVSVLVFDPVTSVVGLSITAVSLSSGDTTGGDTITITGQGFISGATVTLGGVAATDVQVVSSTEITAVTPAHAEGQVDVTVTQDPTPCACDRDSDTLLGGYTYDVPGQLALTGVDPTQGIGLGVLFAACGGLLLVGAGVLRRRARRARSTSGPRHPWG